MFNSEHNYVHGHARWLSVSAVYFCREEQVFTHSTDKTVRVPLLVQCRYELFTDGMTATSAPRSKQLIIVISVAVHIHSTAQINLSTSSSWLSVKTEFMYCRHTQILCCPVS